ncbi:MAG: hypothetical protein ACR2J5_00100 [Geodermatophilaceae bacterium]
MRSHDDLYEAIDSISIAPVDPDRMLARIQTGTQARRRAQRRRVAVVCVGAAAAVIAAVAVVVPSLGSDNPDTGPAAPTPATAPAPTPMPTAPATEQQPEAEPSQATVLGFTPGPRPAGYTTDLAYIQPGLQFFTFEAPLGPERSNQITMQLFDPELSGQATPQPTGETITIDSVNEGPRTVQVIETEPTVDEDPRFGIGWPTGANAWFTVTSDAPGDEARQQVLAAAEEVDLTEGAPLSFPFQLGYVPDGFDPSGALRLADADGQRRASLDFSDDPQTSPIALEVSADNTPEMLENFTPNTTVGQYPALLDGDASMGMELSLVIDGFLVYIYVNENHLDRIDEQAMRRIAESISILPGAAQDDTVWTADPLG